MKSEPRDEQQLNVTSTPQHADAPKSERQKPDTPPSTVQLVLRSDPDIGVADFPITISTGMPMSFALRKWHEANEEV